MWRRRAGWPVELLASLAILGACSAPAAPTVATEPPRSERARKPVDLWNGPGIDAKVLLQQELDRLPDGPFMLRVTELEMSPGASIDPHAHLGPGVQVVLSGVFTTVETSTAAVRTYEANPGAPYPVFSSGLQTRFSTENRHLTDNRLFMAELLPQSRGFLGNQQFDKEGGTHNRGGIRSGPYVQEKLDRLPEPPLMVRVTQIDMGPKGKTPEYTRPGPALFFVASGQATFRRQNDLYIATNGTGGYYFDDAADPIVLENKPITPNRLIAVEFLPASLGKQPSTVPTGREI